MGQEFLSYLNLIAQGPQRAGSTATHAPQFSKKTMNAAELLCRHSHGGESWIHSTRGPLLSLPSNDMEQPMSAAALCSPSFCVWGSVMMTTPRSQTESG